jgi:hypothetical protein
MICAFRRELMITCTDHHRDTRTPRGTSAAPRPSRGLLAPLLLGAVLGCMFAGRPARADDAKPTGTAAERPRVPMIATEGPTRRIEGKIMRSSRGKKGPVRLLVERKDGEPVTVLVASEDVCDRLGLSLKNDEQIVVEGSMLKSERPILIASVFIIGEKTIRVRDAEGKILDPAASAEGAASAATGAASVTGATKAEPSPKP